MGIPPEALRRRAVRPPGRSRLRTPVLGFVMLRDGPRTGWALRVYSTAASFLVLALLPIALARAGTERRLPVRFEGGPRPHGFASGTSLAFGAALTLVVMQAREHRRRPINQVRRRAALFAITRWSFRLLPILPLTWLAAFLWNHRRLRLEELWTDHAPPLLLAAGAAAAFLTLAGSAQARVERLFFRKGHEVPVDGEEPPLLPTAASSAAVPPPPARTGHDRPEEEAGLLCPRCTRIYAPGAGTLCPDDDTPLEPGPVPHLLAGKYRFEKRIGGGGMGLVYRARDVSLSRDVAIKVLPRVSRQAVRRLRREARAAARLIHPNLGVIFAAETWRGAPMLVLEFLDGGTLEDRIACGPIPVGDVVGWGIGLSGALEAAHARKILHRDIKPSNVGFSNDGTPKLFDFGVVRLLDDPASGITDDEGTGPLSTSLLLGPDAAAPFTLTVGGRVAGTAPYLSPEAVQGMPPAPDFDVWSLTLTLYEALTGGNPFAVAPAENAFQLILTTSVPDARVVRPDCPGPLAAFFLTALSRSAQERPATARELRERLERLAT